MNDLEHAPPRADAKRIWNLERDFWLSDADFYAAHLTPECLMVFPEPIGVLDSAETIASLSTSPRWTRVAFGRQRLIAPSDDVAIVAYEAEAHRGDVAYHAQCSSTYARCGEGWRLALHQQTPIARP
jgi:Domain of unknown function (DUF4440)